MDPQYLHWLEIYHPEAIPADRYSLVIAPSSTPIQASSSVVEHFSSVSPVQGANVTGSSTATDTASSSYSQGSHENECRSQVFNTYTNSFQASQYV